MLKSKLGRVLPMAVVVAVWTIACGRSEPAAPYDVILRGGTIYDGSGAPPMVGDIGLTGDSIAALGDLEDATAVLEIDARGLAVAPGFINMMSWSNESLIVDGKSQGDIRQGVTLEVLGEGSSMGPLNDEMKRRMRERQSDIDYEIEWTTLDEYLRFLERRGVSPNVASFIGAETPREYVIGHGDRPPTAAELEQMKDLVRQAMKDGALGGGVVTDLPAGQLC